MRKVRLLFVAALVALAAFAYGPFAVEAQAPQNHTEWLAESLKEMETVKVGMTRADLLKVFEGEGGLSVPERRRYVYRKCPYIKVDVEFELAGGRGGIRSVEGPADKIVKISKPFLEWTITD